jgi:hypothetical protein
MPQIAALFGIAVDPKARPPRPLQVPRGDKGPHKRAGELNKSADGKPGADKPRRGPKPQGSDSQKSTPATPEVATESASPATSPAAAQEPVVAEVAEVAVAAFERMVAPTNYKRPTSLVTKEMVDKAKKTIEEDLESFIDKQ